MTEAEFRKKVIADTGENVHQIELTVAMNCYWTHKIDAKDAWTMALDFMDAMKEIYELRHDRQRNTDSEDQASGAD